MQAKELRLLLLNSETLLSWKHRPKFKVYGPMRHTTITKVAFQQPHESLMAECVTMLDRAKVTELNQTQTVEIPLSINMHIDAAGSKNPVTCMFLFGFFFCLYLLIQKHILSTKNVFFIFVFC